MWVPQATRCEEGMLRWKVAPTKVQCRQGPMYYTYLILRNLRFLRSRWPVGVFKTYDLPVSEMLSTTALVFQRRDFWSCIHTLLPTGNCRRERELVSWEVGVSVVINWELFSKNEDITGMSRRNRRRKKSSLGEGWLMTTLNSKDLLKPSREKL